MTPHALKLEGSRSVRGAVSETTARQKAVVQQWVGDGAPKKDKRISPAERRALAKQRQAQRLRRSANGGPSHARATSDTSTGTSTGTSDPLARGRHRGVSEAERLEIAFRALLRTASTSGRRLVRLNFGDELLDLPPGEALSLWKGRLWPRIAADLRRANLPAEALVLVGTKSEGRNGLEHDGIHFHVVVVANDSLLKAWRKSSMLAPYSGKGVARRSRRAIRDITREADAAQTRHYLLEHLAKEPWPCDRPDGRLEGDRVRLSRDLYDVLVDDGSLPPFTTRHLAFEPATEAVGPTANPRTPQATRDWPVDDNGQVWLFAPPPRLDGGAVRRLRSALGLSQTALGDLLGIGQSALAHVECGDNGLRSANARQLLRLAGDRLGPARRDAILAGVSDDELEPECSA